MFMRQKRLSIIKISMIVQWIYRFSAILIKIHVGFPLPPTIYMPIPKFIQKFKGPGHLGSLAS